MLKNEETVYKTTSQIIKNLEFNDGKSYSKAVLAELRNSVTHPFVKNGLLWQALFNNMPNSFLSRDGSLSKPEKSILNALQLYAIHQQGNDSSVNTYDNLNADISFNVTYSNNSFEIFSLNSYDSDPIKQFNHFDELVKYMSSLKDNIKSNDVDNNQYNRKWYKDNFGQALSIVRKSSNDSTAIDRRFNAMISSNTYDELIYHLRHLTRLIRSKKLHIEINYSKVADDLYTFLSSLNGQEKIKLLWSESYYAQHKGEE
ncbi:type I-E CRISPR-associated protein Cse2/CasB [Nicoliella lavandulae]|uniref:Type I-E CRISPR-associated protein Cse2/CasB n=1 Tax=Nicoliella lavandulae TaxID=3082954 RepID=A0ABU8SMW6_9LACO